jgi:dTMP kinase
MRHHPRKGLFLAFEGIDGSGKDAQVEKTLEWLAEKYGPDRVSNYREPGSTELGEQIRILVKQSTENKYAHANVLLFNAARIQLVEEKIIPDLLAGKIVLLGRYFYSTAAYQSLQGADPEFIWKVNHLATHNLYPEAALYIKISYEEARKRMDARNEKGDKYDEQNADWFRKLIHAYDNIAEDKRMTVINGEQSKEEVFTDIMKSLDRHLRAYEQRIS